MTFKEAKPKTEAICKAFGLKVNDFRTYSKVWRYLQSKKRQVEEPYILPAPEFSLN